MTATGKLLAKIAEGTAKDVDIAVAVAQLMTPCGV